MKLVRWSSLGLFSCNMAKIWSDKAAPVDFTDGTVCICLGVGDGGGQQTFLQHRRICDCVKRLAGGKGGKLLLRSIQMSTKL